MGSSVLLTAFALMLILEGILPFIAPNFWREVFRKVVQMNDGQIRFVGLSSMIAGLVVLWLARMGP